MDWWRWLAVSAVYGEMPPESKCNAETRLRFNRGVTEPLRDCRKTDAKGAAHPGKRETFGRRSLGLVE
jgi:hypothetical protein